MGIHRHASPCNNYVSYTVCILLLPSCVLILELGHMDKQLQVYLQKLRVKELHAILRSLGLSTQGLKHQLVTKIEEYLQDNSDGSVRSVKNRREASTPRDLPLSSKLVT